WVLHGPFSDKSLLRNVLAYHMGESTNRYTPRTQLCELLVNGDYRGVYMFTEKLKRDKNRVDIAKLKSNDISGEELTGGYLFQIDRDDGSTELDGWQTNSSPKKFVAFHDPSYEELADVQGQYLEDYFTSFEETMSGSQYMTNYVNYIDESSWVDYFLVTEVAKHIDAFKLSFYMHKKKSSNGGKIHFGPLWDFNLGFGNFDFACSPTPQGWSYEFQGTCDYSQPFWVKRLTNIPDVSNRINCRWNQLRKGPLHTDSLMQLIDDRLADMGEAPSRNFHRWNTLGNYVWPNYYVGESYQDEITYLKLWLNDRLNWMDENMIGECTISNVEVPSTVYSPIGLFPNPAREYLYVDIDYANLSNMHLKINNPLGELVLEDDFQSNVQRLDISKLPSGLYTVNVLRGNYVVGTKTLVIQ
ncbi:MAG: CotH kinase family protein, partial [Bacteroidia bacterium]|nr:CotH kinase family protein [Bacteroidia bacterium]